MKAATFGKILTLASLALMLVVYTVWYLWHLPEGNLSLWLVKCLPMLLCTPGVLLGYLRVYQWLGFLSMLYFIDGILSIFNLAGDRLIQVNGILLTAASVLLYCAIILFVRGRRRQANQENNNEGRKSHQGMSNEHY